MQIAQSEAPATYRFRLPPGTYRALRFDPLDGEGVVTFSAAKIFDARQKLVTHIAASQFRAVQQIRTLQIDDDSVQMVTVPHAHDPHLAVALGCAAYVKSGSQPQVAGDRRDIWRAVFHVLWSALRRGYLVPASCRTRDLSVETACRVDD